MDDDILKKVQKDFRKEIEEETRYKIAYREVEDHKIKILDIESQLKNQRINFERANEDIRAQIKNLKIENENVFKQIIQDMIIYYSDINKKPLEPNIALWLNAFSPEREQ